jgi:hypothetical protein
MASMVPRTHRPRSVEFFTGFRQSNLLTSSSHTYHFHLLCSTGVFHAKPHLNHSVRCLKKAPNEMFGVLSKEYGFWSKTIKPWE